MAIYTISPSLLKGIEKEEGSYFTNILFIFTNRNNTYKVTKDKHGEVITIYKSIEKNADIIKIWLELMSFAPSAFEKIDIDISNIECEETKFMEICKETKGFNNLIVYSTQNIYKYKCENKKISYDGISISVLDRDDATLALSINAQTGDTYINSQIAKNNSQISDSDNN